MAARKPANLVPAAGIATTAVPAANARMDGMPVDANYTTSGLARVSVAEGDIDIGSISAVIDVAMDGVGGSGDTAGIVDAAGDRLAINADGSINAVVNTVAGLTDAQLRASAVPVSGPLTDAQLRATAVPVSGTFFQGTQPVSAANLPLPTGAATAALQLPNSHDVTVDNAAGASAVNIQDGGNSITVDGPLTDGQLRATPVPISGAVTYAALLTELQGKADLAETQPVSIAAAVAVTSATFATSAKQDTLLTELQLKADLTETQPVSIAGTVATSNSALLTELQLKADLTETQPVSLASVPSHAVTNAGTFAVQSTDSGSGKTLKSAAFSLSATGDAVALVAGKRIKVFAYKMVCSAALVVKFTSAATDLEGGQSFGLNGGAVEGINPPAFLFGTAAGEALRVNITGVGTVAGRVSYWDDDAA